MISLDTFLKILEEDGFYEKQEIFEFKEWYLEKNENNPKVYPLTTSEDMWWDYWFSCIYDY